MQTESRSGTSLEATRVTSYHWFLFVILATATLFEGFDASITSIGSSHIRQDLGISRDEWGIVFGLYRLGMIASFFFLLYADRYGRRALMLVTVVGFAFFTGLTALAETKEEFTMCQFMARLFLTAEFGLAAIVVTEEFPARSRGRAIAILTGVATLGAVLIAKVQPWILLEPGAEGNWLHDAGAIAVVWLQTVVGRTPDGEDWRSLYLLGMVPLAMVFLLRFGMRETRRFEALRGARAGESRPLLGQLRNAAIPWQPKYRKQTALVAVLWNSVHIVLTPATAFWVIRAREDLGLTVAQIGDAIFWAYSFGMLGAACGGYLVDRIGRKWTCAGCYIAASIAVVGLFHSNTVAGNLIWQSATVFLFWAAQSATHIYAAELFPTEIRATGYGWTTNLFGRVTEIGAPIGIALLLPALGISWAVTIVAAGPIIGALIVLRFAPETRGMTLEEIQDHLVGQSSPASSGVKSEKAPSVVTLNAK